MTRHIDHEARKTLRQILEYVGADGKYADYAQLRTYMEWFLVRCNEGAETKPCS